jgi:hypothetical protein
VNTGRYRVARPFRGDAPKVALSEIEWLGAGEGFVVEVVTVILQKRREVWVFLSPVKREQGLAGGGYVDFPLRLVMRKAFTGRAVVSA